ncbi:MAG: hypothetical protein DRN04_08275 [Thermoprotei archaeon]|nr:MAG: hypothetical protein DRN04_08275 [Thermoprotei archaeon]
MKMREFDLARVLKYLYSAREACYEILLHVKDESTTYGELREPLEKISLYLSPLEGLHRVVDEIISEVRDYIELYKLRIFEKVSPEDMKLLAESAKIWEEKVRFLIDNIDAIIGSKQVFTPPQPPATVTRPVSASLICEDTGEKVRISDYCIIGRDPYTNKVTVYDSRGRILYQLNKVDRYVTRYNPRIGKYGHAILLYEENKGWLIEDEYSTNGTYLNGKLIPPKARVKLRNGDIIEIGSTKFKFILY